MGNSLKERAERNGKIRRTIAQIDGTIAKLERVKDEYLEKAIDAKARGDGATYSLCKSALNTTLTQVRRAREMSLNIRIMSELQKMGETNAEFLNGMSVTAKRISKINKKSDFVKLQKEIQKALSGMEEAQAGLDGFLQDTESQVAAISQAQGALSDRKIDALISGRATEREILMDADIDAATADAIRSAKEFKEQQSGARLDADLDGNTGSARSLHASDTEAAPAVAKPFPSPHGAFEFAATGRAKSLDAALPAEQSDSVPDGAVALSEVFEPSGTPRVTLGRNSDGKVDCALLGEYPILLVRGAAESDKNTFLNSAVCELLASFPSTAMRLAAIDVCGGELSAFNGVAHAVCDAVTDMSGVMPTLAALQAERDRRLDIIGLSGDANVEAYNSHSARKLPYIVTVIDGFDGAAAQCDGFERALLRVMRSAGIVGMYFIICSRGTAQTVTPGVAAAVNLEIMFGAAELRTGECIARRSGFETVYRTPFVSRRSVAAIVSALSEDVL